jgi:fucose permease
MLRNRGATPYLASLASSVYWVGMAIGRLVLGFGTDRIGVRRATVLYFLCAVGFEVLFALLSSPTSSVVLMGFLGFVMGPLPKELHIASVSFVSSLGQVGGALLPFAIGAVVQSMGIGVFRYAILLQTVLALVVWIAFTRLRPSVPGARVETRDEASRED